MSFQSFITQQVAALTERLNAIANNAKKIIELPWQSVLRPESEIHVSDAGTSFKIKIQQIFDWFYSIRQNQILSANISILVNEITVAAGAQWIIGNVNYSTLTDTSFSIEYAEDGYTRNDILVADKNNHIIRVIGPETEGISPTPPTPIDTVLVTIISVTDSTIGNTPPIIGGDYEKVINKQNSLAVDGSGTKYPTVDAVNAGLAAIVVPDATTVVKGIVKLAGDLGGTADAPTTPTALHKTGNESWTGQKSASNSNAVGNANLLQINNNYSTNPNGKAFALTSGSTSNSVLMGISLQSPIGGKGIEIVSTSNSNIKPVSIVNNATEVLSIDKSGNVVTTGNVTGANPTDSGHLVTKSYADGLVVGLLDDRGSYNASTNLFPTTGGSGTSGAVLKGDLWYVSVAGTLGGKAVAIGDSFRALVDSPAQVAGNWSVLSSNLSYVPANDANVVHKTGNINETIDGNKVFTNTVAINTSVTAGLQITTTGNRAIVASSGGTSTAIDGTSVDGVGTKGTSSTSTGLVAVTSTGVFIAEFYGSGGRKASISNLGDISGKSFVKAGGLASEYLKADGSVSTLTNPITGTGASGQVSFFNGVSSQSGNANFIWDNTNGRLGLGTPSPTSKLHLLVPNEDGISVESSNRGLIEIRKTGGARWRFQNDLNLVNGLELLYGNNITPTQSVMAFSNNGNVGIGTSNPLSLLTLNNSSGAQIAYRKNDANKWILGMNSGEATENFNLYNYTTSSVNLSVNQTSGNVLIGTTSDNGVDKLQVNGTISAISYKMVTVNDADLAFAGTPVVSSRVTTSSSIDIGFGTADSILESFVYNLSNFGMQRITYTSGGLINKIFIRSNNGGTWSAWVEK